MFGFTEEQKEHRMPTETIETLLDELANAHGKVAYAFESEHGPTEKLIDRCDRLRAAIIDRDRQQRERIAELETILDCRAGKLLKQGDIFIVIKDDEPYYCDAYSMIRNHEIATGRWNDEDEAAYMAGCSYPPCEEIEDVQD